MVEIQIAYEGNLRTTAIHEPSGTRLITDAPKDNHGQGQSFSPTDLLATALGTCMLTIMGIAAKGLKIDLACSTVRMQKEMVASPIRRVGKLTVHIEVNTPTTQEQQQKLRDAAMHCPVHKSLHPDIAMPITFHFQE